MYACPRRGPEARTIGPLRARNGVELGPAAAEEVAVSQCPRFRKPSASSHPPDLRVESLARGVGDPMLEVGRRLVQAPLGSLA